MFATDSDVSGRLDGLTRAGVLMFCAIGLIPHAPVSLQGSGSGVTYTNQFEKRSGIGETWILGQLSKPTAPMEHSDHSYRVRRLLQCSTPTTAE
ncbi:hypothetical protein TIFTF001_004543 [Ficus carica]|uniref:Uncharacterized protein n=1 Tax=Ficus carica TaxID=3494 RepID=A0AA88CY40_FICCA|nr:hypothetical protein TIFTF001_004543 [Ficus carica]